MRVALLLLLALPHLHAARILFFVPQFGYSHVTFQGAIADLLVEYGGHEVDFLMPTCDRTLNKTGTRRGNVIRFETGVHFDAVQFGVWDVASKGALYNVKHLVDVTSMLRDVCEKVIADKDLLDALRAKNYDLGVTEFVFPCGYGIFEVLGIKTTISTSAPGLYDLMGDFFDTPATPSYVPATATPFTSSMSLWERIQNALFSVISQVFRLNFAHYDRLFANHGHSLIVEDLFRKSTYLLVNSDEILDFARPVSQRVVYVGGITLASGGATQKLDAEWEAILGAPQSSNGTIVISFGTVAPAVEAPLEFRDAIVNSARELPEYTVVWKYERPEDGEIVKPPSNLMLKKWLPQQALLADDRVKVFVTHGGLNSVLEISRAGKPAVVIPLFGDQFHNAAMLSNRGSAVVVPKDDLNGRGLAATIRSIVADEKIAARASRLATLIRRKPRSLRDRVLESVQFAIDVGRCDEFDVVGWRDLNVFQYFLIDVLIVLLCVIALALFATLFCLRRTILRTRSSSQREKRD